MDGISGAEDLNDKAGHLLACEVVVMTPQILMYFWAFGFL